MDYTVTNVTTYYVEALDTEIDTWVRIVSDKADREDGGWASVVGAGSYGAEIKDQGHQVRVVEEIVMRAQRTLSWK